MIDIPDAIRDYLIAQSSLTALTAGRIWAERVTPVAGYVPAAGGAIAFITRGGAPEYSGMLNPRVQFKCYGATEAAAAAVYRTLYDVLHDAKDGVIQSAQCEALGQMLTEQEPTPPWPFVLTYFRFLFLPGS